MYGTDFMSPVSIYIYIYGRSDIIRGVQQYDTPQSAPKPTVRFKGVPLYINSTTDFRNKCQNKT